VREVAERVKPAVTQIVTEIGVSRGNILGRQSSQRATGVGTGVIFDKSGYVLTNSHVLTGAQSISVALADGRTFDAKLVGADPDTDLAVIRIESDNLPVAALGDSSQLAVGDGVVAIGHALGLPGGPTVTAGVASALDRTVTEPADDSGPGSLLYDVIQTDAAINPGNSGGPLANMRGEVVGINTLVAAQAEPGVPAQGIGFAIAINTAKPIADQIVASGRAIHPYMGILYQWTGGAQARQLRVSEKQGVLVGQVESGSPANRAGIQPGDLITQIDGQPIADEATLPKTIQRHKPGDTIELTIARGDQEREVQVSLAERPRS